MTATTVRAVPNQPKTPMRSVRVPDDLWGRAKIIAARREETMTDVVRRGLEEYIAEHDEEQTT